MFSADFWRYATERAIKTAAQAGLGVFTADVLLSRSSLVEAAVVVVVATAGSILTSLSNYTAQ